MLNFSKSILMKKQTHLHLQSKFFEIFHFCKNYSFNIGECYISLSNS